MRRRSAPATGTRGALQLADDGVEEVVAPLHQDHHVAGADRRGPRRAAPGGSASQPATVAAMRRARTAHRVVGRRGRRPGRSQGTLVGLLGLRQERPELDAAGLVGVDGVVRDRPGEARRRRRRRRPRPPARGSAARSGRSRAGRSAAARRRSRRAPACSARPWRRTRPGRRPGSCRSTASRRRRRRWCGRPRGRRRRRRTPRRAPRSPATAPGWCPGPRRPGCGRGRRRAARAPRRRCRDARAAPGRGRSGRRSRAGPRAALRASKAASQARAKRLSAAARAKAALARRSGRAASARRHQRVEPGHEVRAGGAGRLGRELADLGGERRRGARAEEQDGLRAARGGAPGSSVASASARQAAALPSLPLRAARTGRRPRSRASASGVRTCAASSATVISGRAPRQAASACRVERPGEGGAVLARSRRAAGRGRRSAAAGPAPRTTAGSASASASSTSSRRARAWRSSRTPNCGATPASSGKRRSSASQKAWMVWIFRPPGVSSARANSVRARASCAGGRAPAGSPRRVEGLAQRGVVEHRPGAEGPEQPVLHLRRRGLGVGEAEDLLRLGAGEQQARHPVGEHPGLAGAGVGGDPARGRGGGGADLGGDRRPSPGLLRSRRRRPIRPCATGGRSRCPR